MSLQIWLPFNGNLDNFGLNTISTTGTPSYDSNGKIGACLQSQITLSNYTTYLQPSHTNSISVACWIKSSRCDYIMACNAFELSCSSSWVQFRLGNGNSNTYQALTSIKPLADTWNHIVGIWNADSKQVLCYLNGELVASTQCANNINFNTISASSELPYNGTNVKINDFRIYDHALSAKEVKDLAKGLVLHYRLAGPGQENLITGNFSCTSTNTIYKSQGTVDCVLTAADLMANQGRTLTLSYDVYSLGDYTQNTTGSWQADRFGIHGAVNYTKSGSSTSTQDYPLANLLSRGKSGRVFTSWKIPTGVTSFNTGLGFSVQTNGRDGYAYPASNNSSTWYLKNVKLEWGSIVTPWCPNPADALYNAMGYNNNIEYDCSGYRRNGTKNGTITWDIDSPRYTTSYSALSDYPIKAEVNMPSCDSMTVSFWTKITTFGAAKSGLFATSNMSTDPTDYNDTAMAQRDSDIDLKGVSGSGKIFNFTAPSTGQWHHCVFVYDGSKVYYYQDGKKINEEACAIGALKSYQYFYLGYSKAGGVVRKTLGKWSDLRIYTTALSAEDIAELYHSAVIVDNTGKNYAYEYFEA